jgi:hypothetical protein
MKKLMVAVFVMALFVPAIALARSSGQQDDKNTQAQQNQAAQTDQMGGNTMPKHNMSGMVSNDGKTFTSDNKSYIVKNPKALKGYDNQSVAVEFRFNTDSNTIRILSVSPAQAPSQ